MDVVQYRSQLPCCCIHEITNTARRHGGGWVGLGVLNCTWPSPGNLSSGLQWGKQQSSTTINIQFKHQYHQQLTNNHSSPGCTENPVTHMRLRLSIAGRYQIPVFAIRVPIDKVQISVSDADRCHGRFPYQCTVPTSAMSIPRALISRQLSAEVTYLDLRLLDEPLSLTRWVCLVRLFLSMLGDAQLLVLIRGGKRGHRMYM